MGPEMLPTTIIIRSVRYRAWVGTTIVFLITLPFWLGKPFLDSYVAYSGTVVDRGTAYDILSGEEDSYIVIEDSRGVRTRRYVTDLTDALLPVGSFVVKKRGFGEVPLRPDRPNPRDRIGELEKAGLKRQH